MERTVCENGIQLQVNRSDKFTRNMISVNFIMPLDKVKASENCLLGAVMGRGCRMYPEIDKVSDFLDTHYGATFTLGTGKKGENQVIRFSVSYIDEKYTDGSIDMEKDMLSFLSMMITDNLIISPEAVEERTETEKKNLIDAIRANINEKTSYANMRCAAHMFSNELYGIDSSGSIEEIEKLSANDLPRIFNNLIFDSTITVFALGRFDADALKGWVNSLFSEKYPGFHCSRKISPTLIKSAANEVKYFVEKDSMTQAKLVMGFRTGAENYMQNAAGYVLFNAIFATSPCSRLFVNVREKESLCYYCSSVFDRHKGIMLVYSGISADNKEKVKASILRQIKDISEEISDEELYQAKKMLIDSIGQSQDSPTAMESHFLNAVVSGTDISPEEYREMIILAQKEDVMAAAKAVSLDTVYFLEGSGSAEYCEDEEIYDI